MRETADILSQDYIHVKSSVLNEFLENITRIDREADGLGIAKIAAFVSKGNSKIADTFVAMKSWETSLSRGGITFTNPGVKNSIKSWVIQTMYGYFNQTRIANMDQNTGLNMIQGPLHVLFQYTNRVYTEFGRVFRSEEYDKIQEILGDIKNGRPDKLRSKTSKILTECLSEYFTSILPEGTYFSGRQATRNIAFVTYVERHEFDMSAMYENVKNTMNYMLNSWNCDKGNIRKFKSGRSSVENPFDFLLLPCWGRDLLEDQSQLDFYNHVHLYYTEEFKLDGTFTYQIVLNPKGINDQGEYIEIVDRDRLSEKFIFNLIPDETGVDKLIGEGGNIDKFDTYMGSIRTPVIDEDGVYNEFCKGEASPCKQGARQRVPTPTRIPSGAYERLRASAEEGAGVPQGLRLYPDITKGVKRRNLNKEIKELSERRSSVRKSGPEYDEISRDITTLRNNLRKLDKEEKIELRKLILNKELKRLVEEKRRLLIERDQARGREDFEQLDSFRSEIALLQNEIDKIYTEINDLERGYEPDSIQGPARDLLSREGAGPASKRPK